VQTPSPTPIEAIAASPIGDFLAVVDEYGWAVFSLLSILAGLALLWKIWPMLSQVVIIINAAKLLPQMQEDVKAIKHQVFPNDGGSLQDDVTSIRTTVDRYTKENDTRVKSIEGSVRSLHKKLNSVQQTVTKAHPAA